MNKYILIGILILSVVFTFTFLYHDKPSNDYTTSDLPNFLRDVKSPAIEFNNLKLVDSTNYDSVSNTCSGSRNNMDILVSPCIATDIDVQDIRQNVNFIWNGNQARNITWVFVYDGQLKSGSISLYRYATRYYNQSAVINQWINNYLVDRVVNYTDLGTPNNCDFGNLNNTMMYEVTRWQGVTNNLTTSRYCFSSRTTVNSTAFRISGNRDASTWTMTPVTGYGWDDVTDRVQYLGKGLLQDTRNYYKVEDVTFNPGQVYNTTWIYTPKDNEKSGKWHILGFETETGLINSITSDRYIYLDPWWSGGTAWNKRRAITITNNYATALNSYSVKFVINRTTAPTSQTDFGDIRIVNDSGYQFKIWNETTNTTTAEFYGYFPSLPTGNTTVYMYYENSLVADDFNISQAFLVADHFEGTTLDSTKWTALTASGGTVNMDNNSTVRLVANSGGLAYGAIKTAGTYGPNYTIRTKMNYYTPTSGMVKVFAFTKADGGGANICAAGSKFNYLGSSGTNFWGRTYDGSTGTTGAIVAPPINGTDVFELIRNDTTVYVSRNYSSTFNQITTGLFTDAVPVCVSAEDTSTNNIVVVDWIYVRPIIKYEPTITFGNEEVNVQLISYQIYPQDELYTQTFPSRFECNFSSTGGNLTNASIILKAPSTSELRQYYTLNGTFAEKNATMGFSEEGLYRWECEVSSTTSFYATGNRRFTYDRTAPNITVISPTQLQEYQTTGANGTVLINVTQSDNVGVASCWYNNFTANISMICNQTLLLNLTPNSYRYTFYVNDTVNLVTASNETNFYVSQVIPKAVNFSRAVVEGENNTIRFNVTLSKRKPLPLSTTANATLHYNGLKYPMTLVSSSDDGVGYNFSFSATVPAPLVEVNSYRDFNITYYINDFYYNTTNYTQSIYNIPNLTVNNTCSPSAITFSLADEESLSNIGGSFEYNFFYGISNSTLVKTYGNLSSQTGFSVCINDTLAQNFTIGYGEITYRNETHVDRRYYLFSGMLLINITQNITLYDLLTTSQTSFQTTVQDNSFNPLSGYYVSLLRWYPAQNQYRVVEMGETDDKGQTVTHVKTQDVDYRFAVYNKNGTLVKLFSSIRLICQTLPCTYSLFAEPDRADLATFNNIQSGISWNTTSKQFTLTWSDPSMNTQFMNLTVYGGLLNSTVICSTQGSGYIGVLTCNVSGYEGTLRAVAMRKASDWTMINQKIVDVVNTILDVGGSSVALIAGIFLLIFMAFVGIFSPVLVVIFGVLAFIPLLLLGGINWAVMGAIAVLGGVILHFMRRVAT